MNESERRALKVFREFLITPGQMLCFYGPKLKKHRAALRELANKQLIVKEGVKGGFTLTSAGFAAMKECE